MNRGSGDEGEESVPIDSGGELGTRNVVSSREFYGKPLCLLLYRKNLDLK